MKHANNTTTAALTRDQIDPAAFQEWLAANDVTTHDEDEMERMYREDLDTEPVRIGSLEYDASYVLEQIDPTAFRCGFLDYIDGIAEDITETELFGASYLDPVHDEDDLIQDYLDEMNADLEEEEEEDEEEEEGEYK